LHASRLDAARQRAEVLRLAVRAMQVSHEGMALGQVTISIGLSTLELKGEPIGDVLKRADTALYRAKHDGRNRVVSAAA